MKVMAFDLGTTWACASNVQSSPYTHHWVIEGARAAKLNQFRQQLDTLFTGVNDLSTRPEAIVFERPFCRGQAANRMLWGMAGVLEAKATEYGYPIIDVAVATIKVFAAGKGSADKEDMIAAAFILGYCGTNEHEADAFCLMRYTEANAIHPEETVKKPRAKRTPKEK
jgi:Holliday junction resolvasome RuvABC endonuclease subunit